MMGASKMPLDSTFSALSSGGAAQRHSYVTPMELEANIVIKAINIGFLRSRSEAVDNNFNTHNLTNDKNR
jgi:hypothetical protein